MTEPLGRNACVKLLLQKAALEARIQHTTDRRLLNHLNRLWWKLRFSLEGR